jgi:hypothetical protein
VQGIAAWLVARPQNAVLALAVTLLLPAPQLTSGVILVLLVLAQGARLAGIETAVAAAALLTVSLFFGVSTASLLALMAATWLPVALLAVLLLRTRSLTLTLQVSVIAACVCLAGFYVIVADPAAFWQPYLVMMAEVFEQNNLQLNTELLSAEVMTVSVVLAMWMMYVVGLLLGYALYRRLPTETAALGQFQDLNFGRVLAFAMAVIALLAFVAGLQNTAYVLFVVFWIQGLAIVHWLHGKGRLPLAAVIAVYALLPFLQVLLMMALAVLGYVDAWFGFRRRMKMA